jgi:hypothetical protein
VLPGRPPKPDGQKVNRHKPTHGPAVTLPAKPSRPAPEPAADLAEDAERLWARAWALPESAMWSDADVPAMTRLVTMQADPTAWNNEKKMAEMRQLEDRFGLNPYARRQLGWKIEGEAEASAKPAQTARGGRTQLKVV